MEITRETPINFITFSYQDQKNYLNNSVARMCMDSWKIAFPNLNIINIDVTEEIANMNEFSKFCYSNGAKSYTTDPLRLYYVNQYDNCVYCDTDVYIKDISVIIDLMNNNNEFIIHQSGMFTWNKYRNNQKYKDYYKQYNKLGLKFNKRFENYFNKETIIDFLSSQKCGDWLFKNLDIIYYDNMNNYIYHIAQSYELRNIKYLYIKDIMLKCLYMFNIKKYQIKLNTLTNNRIINFI